MANINSKTIAQNIDTSKAAALNTGVSRNEKISMFGDGVCKYVSEHRDCVEQIEGKQEWILKGVDLGKGPSDFHVVIDEGVSKTGRKLCKREMYRIIDGKETVVQFGTLKKKYLYKLMLHLCKGDKARVKNEINPSLVKSITAAIRADHSAFSKAEDGSWSGSINDIGKIKYMELPVSRKSGKQIIERQLYIDDKIALKGTQLGMIANALLNKTRGARKVADLMAEGEAVIADMV